jgi:hypothetical protein
LSVSFFIVEQQECRSRTPTSLTGIHTERKEVCLCLVYTLHYLLALYHAYNMLANWNNNIHLSLRV